MRRTIVRALLVLAVAAAALPQTTHAYVPPGGGHDACIICWRYGVPSACRECLQEVYWDGCHPDNPLCY